MFSFYHQSQLNVASKCGCGVMQIEHIFINLISTLDEDRIQNMDWDMMLS